MAVERAGTVKKKPAEVRAAWALQQVAESRDTAAQLDVRTLVNSKATLAEVRRRLDEYPGLRLKGAVLYKKGALLKTAFRRIDARLRKASRRRADLWLSLVQALLVRRDQRALEERYITEYVNGERHPGRKPTYDVLGSRESYRIPARNKAEAEMMMLYPTLFGMHPSSVPIPR